MTDPRIKKLVEGEDYKDSLYSAIEHYGNKRAKEAQRELDEFYKRRWILTREELYYLESEDVGKTNESAY